jgi:hypothetical protein
VVIAPLREPEVDAALVLVVMTAFCGLVTTRAEV